MKIQKFLLVFLIILTTFQTKADEGMWIPMLLEKYNIADMQEKGFKLTAEDIYSVNQASMKDAVMIFGRGCTGELISNQGLLITNHHCGYGQIQAHSSVEHDYLTNGYWAMSKEQELACPGLNVTFLIRMEDVSTQVLNGVTAEMSEEERQKIIKKNSVEIAKTATAETHYEASIKPFYYGNEYYLFVYEVFNDVRYVGSPPSAIGKFGGDTDNWMWPRHTGDFSLFRIYANQDNQPAEYAADNVPYQPKKYFAIAMDGVKKDDFTMVFGYPYKTEEYLTSYAIQQKLEIDNPHRIKARQKKIDILTLAMNADAKVRIQYAAKHAGISNAWKKWIGESKGLTRMHAVEKKEVLEKRFQEWANSTPENKKKYGSLLPQLKTIYTKLTPYRLAYAYYYEAGVSLDIVSYAGYWEKLITEKKIDTNTVENLKKATTGFYKNYNATTDKKLVTSLLQLYYDNVDANYQPTILLTIKNKYKGHVKAYTDQLYLKSKLVSEEKAMNLLNNFNGSTLKKLEKDPLYLLRKSIVALYDFKIKDSLLVLNNQIDLLQRTYMEGLLAMDKDKLFYPDANQTLRVAYGKVNGYEPIDGVSYKHYTTLEGIIEKDNPEIYDYDVPDQLKTLYNKKDYGQYAENGEVHVCFIASNHTTGGNSGSPVLNANGDLIGVNFDRCWEGTMSDIMYDKDQCRNIALDIRYALFIIDKFAGADHLIKEMSLVRKNPVEIKVE